MKRLLITGFEPFGKETVNPSWEAVSRLPSEVGGYSLTKLLLPVVFGKAFDIVVREAERINPDVILCIGQAGGRSAITPELVGINLRHADIPDNEGFRPCDEFIIKNGDAAYFATVPARRIAEAIKASDIPSSVSYSAGTYVCNDILYSLLGKYENSDTRVGFIHVPHSEVQGKEPCMKLTDIVKALTVAIENLD